MPGDKLAIIIMARRIAASNLAYAIGERINQAEFLQSVQDKVKDLSREEEQLYRSQNPSRIRIDVSDFVDMNDGELLEHYTRVNNPTALQKIVPRLSIKRDVTTPMMIAILSTSINFLRTSRDNPSICGCCSDYLPLLHFRISYGSSSLCAKCLRAKLLRQKSLTTTGKCWCGLKHAPEIFIMSDLDDRHRAQRSSDYHRCGC
ncbi:uncharacterized protein Bfra_006597 [Botrytis fragariae]|uniref:Uncharacterized protein n=1 Tax=Botrytis fragariae TaxID=1964551 RepID=A0A8H6B569_9HELO|nr:uncharacterized protein Bfra_006597 [Botrytis fragariae]KAF5879388.1 hypothetical protein Bfra_006597 [Botrytis fragariae]